MLKEILKDIKNENKIDKEEVLKLVKDWEEDESDNVELIKFIINNLYYFHNCKIIVRKRVNFKCSDKSGYIELSEPYKYSILIEEYKLPAYLYTYDKNGKILNEIDLEKFWNKFFEI